MHHVLVNLLDLLLEKEEHVHAAVEQHVVAEVGRRQHERHGPWPEGWFPRLDARGSPKLARQLRFAHALRARPAPQVVTHRGPIVNYRVMHEASHVVGRRPGIVHA